MIFRFPCNQLYILVIVLVFLWDLPGLPTGVDNGYAQAGDSDTSPITKTATEKVAAGAVGAAADAATGAVVDAVIDVATGAVVIGADAATDAVVIGGRVVIDNPSQPS